jgi:hypothetical protein
MSAAEYVLKCRARSDGRLRDEKFFDHLVITCGINQWARHSDQPAFNILIEKEWEDWLLGSTATLPVNTEFAFLRPDGTLLLLGENQSRGQAPGHASDPGEAAQ